MRELNPCPTNHFDKRGNKLHQTPSHLESETTAGLIVGRVMYIFDFLAPSPMRAGCRGYGDKSYRFVAHLADGEHDRRAWPMLLIDHCEACAPRLKSRDASSLCLTRHGRKSD